MRARRLSISVTLLALLATLLPAFAGSAFASGSTVVVKPSAMNSWYFWNDYDETFTGSPGALVAGPSTPPLGTGSVELGPLTSASGATAHSVIATDAYFGTALADLTALSYSSYQPGPTLAIALQFDVRYRATDIAYGGRLVFEPYQNGAATVGSGWQSWSPLAGTWWASKTTAAGTGGTHVVALPVGNCAQATPCTWAQLMAAFPDAQVYGRFLLKAGSNWPGFDGNADALTVGVSGADTTYDFEAETSCTTDCYVDAATGDDTFGGDTPSSAKKTIQAGVTAVDPNGTVHVASGTYDEVGQIVIDHTLAIVGSGASKPVIRPTADTGTGGDARGFILVNNGVGFDLTNVVIDGNGFKVWQGIRDQGPGTISGVDFRDIRFFDNGTDGQPYAGTALAAFGSGNVDVLDSTFEQIGRIGVQYYFSGITGSTYSGNTYVGKGPGDWIDYGVEVGAGAVATIEESSFSGNLGFVSSDGSTSAGVFVNTYFGLGTAATILNNDFTNNSIAIFDGYVDIGHPSDTSIVEAHFNSIAGNGEGFVHTLSTETADATCNWWGAADGPGDEGPGSGDGVNGTIDYSPWQTSPNGPCNGPVMQSKQAVRTSLADMLPTLNKHDNHEIGEAIKHLDKSLDADLWVDATHLDAKHGNKVFDEEKDAVKHLDKVDSVDVSAEMNALVDADYALASTAIADASSATVVNPPKHGAKEIAKANEELAKGDTERAGGDLDKAIDHYKKAWEHAQKALEEAAKS